MHGYEFQEHHLPSSGLENWRAVTEFSFEDMHDLFDFFTSLFQHPKKESGPEVWTTKR